MQYNEEHPGLNYNKAFAWGIALNILYIVIEILYGLLTNSIALIADAGHNLSDVIGLLLAWGASYLSRTMPTQKRTYGMRKSTILAALFNSILLFIAVGAILIESIRRFIEPREVQAGTMIAVAGVGVIINAATALLFMKGKGNDLNIKGAYLHMAADSAVSLGVVIAGILIIYTHYYFLDPIISMVIVIVIIAGTWGLLKDSFNLSMDAVPENINIENVKEYLNKLPGVAEIHDLHIWAMSTTEVAFTVHLVMPDGPGDDKFLSRVCKDLYQNYHIEHPTIQVEKNAQAANCSIDRV